MTLDDLEDLLEVFSDPITMQHYPKPFDRTMTTGWIEWNLRNYQQHGFGLWAMIHKEDRRLIGDCGLTFQRVDGVDELEIGYHVLRSYWRRGTVLRIQTTERGAGPRMVTRWTWRAPADAGSCASTRRWS